MKYLCSECDLAAVVVENDRCYFCREYWETLPNCPCGSPVWWILDSSLCYDCEQNQQKESRRIWSQECARQSSLEECQDCGEWILFDIRCPSCETDHDARLNYLMDDRFTSLNRSLWELG